MEIKTAEEIHENYLSSYDNFKESPDLNTDFQHKKYISIEDVKDFLREEIDRSGSSIQILEEFNKQVSE